MTLEPYYSDSRCTIYLGDTLHVLAGIELPAGQGVDVLATAPPYSSGGQFRGDRTASTGRSGSHARHRSASSSTRPTTSARTASRTGPSPTADRDTGDQ